MVLIAIGFAGLNLISCGADEAETDSGIKQLTAEEQKDLVRFVEYVFFSTAPYVDKSWVETDVPEDEVVENLIDFAMETAAIQQVYTEFYHAYNQRNINVILANVHPGGNEFGFPCPERWALSKITLKSAIHDFWHNIHGGCGGCQWGTDSYTDRILYPP